MTNTISPQRAGADVSRRKPSVVRDFTLGARLSVGADRASWWRFISIAVGVGFGLGLLLLAACMPGLTANRSSKAASLAPELGGLTIVSIEQSRPDFRGMLISGQLVGVLPDAVGPLPVPPGLGAFPAQGEFFVSPALEAALKNPNNSLLRERLPLPITGLIGESGLVAPNDLRFYTGVPGNQQHAAAGWQKQDFNGYYNSSVWTVVVVFSLAMVLPIFVFIAVASRLGGDRRDALIVDMHRIGASRNQLRRIVAGETLPPVLVGVFLWVSLLLLARLTAAKIAIFGYQAFGTDLDPQPGAALALVIAIPILTLWVGWLAAKTSISRLDRGSLKDRPPLRKLLWRIACGLIGTSAVIGGDRLMSIVDYSDAWWLVANSLWLIGVALLIAFVPLILPPISDLIIRKLPVGGPSTTLAIRRIQADLRTVSRVISGVAVLIALAVALQASLHAAVRKFEESSDSTTVVVSKSGDRSLSSAESEFIANLPQSVPGARFIALDAQTPGVVRGEASITSVIVLDCDQLRELSSEAACPDQQVYFGPDVTVENSTAPVTLELRLPAGLDENEVSIFEEMVVFIPRSQIRSIPGLQPNQVLFTADSLRAFTGSDETLNRFGWIRWTVDVSAAGPDSIERIRNAADAVPADLSVYWPGESPYTSYATQTQNGLRFALTLGTLLALAFAAFTLGLQASENARNQRRPLALMVAGGVPPSVLGRAQLIAAAIPFALALAIGVVLGGILVIVLGLPSQGSGFLDWSNLGIYVASAVVLTAVVGAFGLRAVRRAARPEAIQTS